MTPRRRILIILVIVAAAAATTWGVMGRHHAGPAMAVIKVHNGAASAPITSATAAPRADDQPTPVTTATDAPLAAAGPALALKPGTDAIPQPAVTPASPTSNPAPVATASKIKSADWAAQAAHAPAAKTDQPYIDPAAQMIAAMAASRNPGSPSFGGGGASGGTNNLAPLPGGAGLVINDGRIPVGFVIDPKEYTGGVLRITNVSGTPAILTINDPAAAAACSIAGEAVVVGKPYQVDGLEITAAHPVAVFVQPGRAPGPPAAPRPPRSDG
jgi:hypothetical protein